VYQRSLFVGLIGGLATALPGAVSAQDTLEDGFYVRAGAGVSFVSDLEQDVTFSPFLAFPSPASNGQTVETETGFVAGGALGFDYADGIRTELEYRYQTAGVESVTRTGGLSDPTVVTPPSDDLIAHLLMANFFYDFRNSMALTPFIGLGVGGAFVENENGDRDAALAYQGRAGLSLSLSDGFSVDAEYIYLRTNDLVYGPEDDDFTLTGPAVRIDGDGLSTSTVMVSLRKQF